MQNSIAIIDDEEDICFLLGNILRQENHRVFWAHSLLEGKKILNKEKASLLFLDNNLPDGSGIEHIEWLKLEYPNIKIIIISAFDGPRERHLAKEKGADHFVGKPFTREEIRLALNSISFTK